MDSGFKLPISFIAALLLLASCKESYKGGNGGGGGGSGAGPTAAPPSAISTQGNVCEVQSLIDFSGLDSIDQIGGSSVRLVWSAPVGAANFQIFKVEGTVSTYLKTVDAPLQSAIVSGLMPGTPYRFFVRMIDHAGKIDSNSIVREATTLTLPSPSEIQGLLAWYSADRIDGTPNNGLADGYPITNWTDLASSAVSLVQANVLLQPKLRLSSLNGQPALEFNGTQSELKVDINLPETSYTFAVVFKTADNSGTLLAAVSPTSSSAGSHDRQFGISGSKFTNRVWNSETIASASPINTLTPHVGIVTLGPRDQHKLYLDSVNVASGVKTASDFHWQTGLMVGNHSFWGAYAGLIAEILIYNQELNESDRKLLESYLMGKYGIP
jgi:hypothetical protein